MSRTSVLSPLRTLAVLLALALVTAACGGAAEQGAAPATEGGESTATESETTETEAAETGSETEAGSTEAAAVLTDPYSEQLRRASEETVDTSEFKTDPPYNIATIVQGPTNGWGTIFDAVMNYELKQSGKIKDQLYVPWDFTTESQANGIDDAISKKVDAILLTSLSRAGLAGPVEKATDAGIPVITCMAGVESDAYTVEVSRNIPAMGYDSAKWLAERLNGEGKIIMMHGIAGVDAAEFWKSGAMAAFEEYPGIEILAEEYANWSVADATTAMRSIMRRHRDIDGIWAGGMEMGMGIVNAMTQQGQEMPPIAGTGQVNGFLRLAQEHDLEYFVSPFPPGASKLCVDVMFRVLNGEPVQKYIDVKDEMEGTAPFGAEEGADRYYPQFNDDFIDPIVVPEKVYMDAGFGR